MGLVQAIRQALKEGMAILAVSDSSYQQ